MMPAPAGAFNTFLPVAEAAQKPKLQDRAA